MHGKSSCQLPRKMALIYKRVFVNFCGARNGTRSSRPKTIVSKGCVRAQLKCSDRNLRCAILVMRNIFSPLLFTVAWVHRKMCLVIHSKFVGMAFLCLLTVATFARIDLVELHSSLSFEMLCERVRVVGIGTKYVKLVKCNAG